jgi:hypothetical protein
MATDQTELLKKFIEHQDKQAQFAQGAACKAKKMMPLMSMMSSLSKSHSSGRHKTKKSSMNKLAKTN